jgi:hypothetical protein
MWGDALDVLLGNAFDGLLLVVLQSHLKCPSNQRAALPGPFAYPPALEALKPSLTCLPGSSSFETVFTAGKKRQKDPTAPACKVIINPKFL